jgi:hypothetical protein
MYEARKVCNFLLANFNAVELNITNLRINKLLFFIQVAALHDFNPNRAVGATFEGAFSEVTRSYAGRGVVRYQW